MVLLREARRVATKVIIIKDHFRNGPLAERTLRFMDTVGNRRRGVALPYTYMNADEWERAFAAVDLRTDFETRRLSLYPWPATWLFDRSWHFIARLAVPDTASSISGA